MHANCENGCPPPDGLCSAGTTCPLLRMARPKLVGCRVFVPWWLLGWLRR
jgi:hypothetical protein